jgi:hypothetical protein
VAVKPGLVERLDRLHNKAPDMFDAPLRRRLPKSADAYKLARAFDDPKDRALVLERYSQSKEDPIHIIVLDVQRVKRRAERATDWRTASATRFGVVTSRR